MRIIVDVTSGTVTEDAAWLPRHESEPPGPPPAAITRRQLRLWLVRHGYTLAQVEALVDTLPEPQRTEARIEWECATAFEREHPLLRQLAGQLFNLSGDQLDAALNAAFTQAASL